MNYVFNATIFLPWPFGAARLCGRVPMWSPESFSSNEYSLGVCVIVDVGQKQWRVEENDKTKSVVLGKYESVL